MKKNFSASRASPIPAMLAFVAGVCTTQQLPELPSGWFIATTLMLAAVLYYRHLRLPASFLLGASWAVLYASLQLAESLPQRLERKDLLIEGVIAGLPQALGNEGVRFNFKVTRHEGSLPIPTRIRLNWYRHVPPIKAGERWRLRVRLKRPHGYSNPGGLDYEQWLFARGIRATGYVREDPLNQRLQSDVSVLDRGRWRQGLYDRLERALASSPLRGIVEALTMGEESGITPDQWDVLRRTGTAHLVAISGSHIGLVAGLCYFLTLKLCAALGLVRWPPPSLAACIAMTTALLYSALADFAIPTQRALVMISLVMGGIVLRRNLRPAYTLAVALLAVTVVDPLATLAPGFWLSFGAVALILFSASGLLRAPHWREALWKMNWVTALGLAPLLLLFFQQLSLISPIANLLAVPSIGMLLIPWCVLSAAVLTLSEPAGACLFAVGNWFLQGVWYVLEWLSALPLAQWEHAQPAGWPLFSALAGVALLLSPRGVPGRWLGLILLAPALTFQPERPAAGGLRLTLLDVGQGLSAVLQTRRHTLVYDTGAWFSPSFDMGSAVLEPFLVGQGVNTVDMLVISHGDNDHIGGAQSLLERFPIRQAYSSVPDRIADARRCGAGQAWNWDGIRFDMLSPIVAAEHDNDNSCVLKASTAEGCVLLTGDIEKAAEQRLVDRYGDTLRCEVIVVPHHGSRTSSTAPLLARVRPRWALIPAGYLNRYGFPAQEVVERYRALGARVLSSADSGAITLDMDDDKGLGIPSRFRDTHRRYWNDASPKE